MKRSMGRVSKLLDKTVLLTLDDERTNEKIAAYHLAVHGNRDAMRLFDSLMTSTIATGRSRYLANLEVARLIYDGDEEKGLERYEKLLEEIQQAEKDN